MICTGKYDNVADCGLKLFSVSDDINKNKEFGLETYSKLLPSDEFLNKYKNADLKDFSLKKKFIVDYWNEVLMDLNPYLVIKELIHSLVVDFKEIDELSYRDIIAAWFELFLGEDIYEIVFDGEEPGVIERPSYIKEVLEDAIKSSIDMKGYKSIQALCFYENSLLYYERANIFESENKLEVASEMREIADYLGEVSLEVEKSYNGNMRKR